MHQGFNKPLILIVSVNFTAAKSVIFRREKIWELESIDFVHPKYLS